jgi:cytochrome b561
MGWRNSAEGYGGATKLYHWAIVGLFAFQYAVALAMTRMAEGAGQNTAYNWHKSIGLVALAVAIGRVANRRRGRLPDWAPTLSEGEKRFIHRAEQALYTFMFVMPVSGFIYVMAGGYGVALFGEWDLPNPIGARPWLAAGAKWVHVVSALLLAGVLAGHIGLVLRHQFILRDGLLRRMLPRR